MVNNFTSEKVGHSNNNNNKILYAIPELRAFHRLGSDSDRLWQRCNINCKIKATVVNHCDTQSKQNGYGCNQLVGCHRTPGLENCRHTWHVVIAEYKGSFAEQAHPRPCPLQVMQLSIRQGKGQS